MTVIVSYGVANLWRPIGCALQEIDPALIERFRAATLGCFVLVDPTTPPAS